MGVGKHSRKPDRNYRLGVHFFYKSRIVLEYVYSQVGHRNHFYTVNYKLN